MQCVCVCVYRKEDEAISRKYIKDNNKKKKREMQLAPGRIWQIGCCAVCKREKDEKNAARRGGYIIYNKKIGSQPSNCSLTQCYMPFVLLYTPANQSASSQTRVYTTAALYNRRREKPQTATPLFTLCGSLYIIKEKKRKEKKKNSIKRKTNREFHFIRGI